MCAGVMALLVLAVVQMQQAQALLMQAPPVLVG